MNWKKLTPVLALSFFFLGGCQLMPFKPVSPVKYEWGNKGETPTAVWPDYDWVITANPD